MNYNLDCLLAEEKKEPQFPFECKGGVCPIKPKDKSPAEAVDQTSGGDQAKEKLIAAEDKKEI